MRRQLTFQEYENQALTYKLDTETLQSILLGVCGEAGEIAELFKKHFRGDYVEIPRGSLANEIGDVLWYLNALANEYGLTLSGCAELNITKLQSRKNRGVLQGSGDNR